MRDDRELLEEVFKEAKIGPNAKAHTNTGGVELAHDGRHSIECHCFQCSI
jgi:hypothetical protein